MRIDQNIKINGHLIRYHVQADSYGDFLTWIDEHKTAALIIKNNEISDRRFAGTADFEEAENLAKHGWSFGIRKIGELFARIEHKLFSFLKRRKTEYHFAGGLPDVGAYLASDPECFVSFHEADAQGVGKLARIAVNIATSAAFTTDQMLVRGVAVAAVVDAMEQQGRSCEIVLMQSVDSRGRWEFEIPIKSHGEHLDLERLAFALAHPSFLRRYLFVAEDILGMEDYRYGCPEETYLDRGDLYFPAMSFNQCPATDEKVLEWVLSMLQAQGIELEDV